MSNRTFLDEVKAAHQLNKSILVGKYEQEKSILVGKYEQELREKILDASKDGLMHITIDYRCYLNLETILQAIRNICTEPGFKYCLDTPSYWRITLSWEFPA